MSRFKSRIKIWCLKLCSLICLLVIYCWEQFCAIGTCWRAGFKTAITRIWHNRKSGQMKNLMRRQSIAGYWLYFAFIIKIRIWRERECIFIKYDMPCYVYTTRMVQTFISFVSKAITNEYAFTCVIIKLMLIVISQVWIASTNKTFQHLIISFMFEKFFIWCQHFKSWSW